MSEHHASTGKWHSPPSKKAAASHAKADPSKGGAANEGEGGSGRALWKGSISFGLVQIPVSMSTAERANELAFHQLDRRDESPVGYDRINKRTGEKVAWSDIVKGYEISKGKYVLVTDEDFEKANVEASQTVDIIDFVPAAEIPPAYFERPYHLLPEGKKPKAYAVLRDAMAKKDLVAVALVVIRTRQRLAAVMPRGELLDLELLRFAHELREPPASELDFPTASPQELHLAEQLIESMTGHWEPTKYKDTYRDELLQAIHEKAKTGVIEPHHVPGAERAAPVTDLLEVLQRSVKASAEKGHAKKHAHGKHQAA